MALYQGLVEYDPKTLDAIPALAERWDMNNDSSEFVFHLRRNARWSNGDPITAHDFVYSLRRGLAPALASKNAYLAYYIINAQALQREGRVRQRSEDETISTGKGCGRCAGKQLNALSVRNRLMQHEPEYRTDS